MVVRESFLLNKCSTHLSMQCGRSGSYPSPVKLWIGFSFDRKLVSHDSAGAGIRKRSLVWGNLPHLPPKVVETSLQSVHLQVPAYPRVLKERRLLWDCGHYEGSCIPQITNRLRSRDDLPGRMPKSFGISLLICSLIETCRLFCGRLRIGLIKPGCRVVA